MQTAAHVVVEDDRHPHGPADLDEILKDAVGRVLLDDADAGVREQVVFQRLQLDNRSSPGT